MKLEQTRHYQTLMDTPAGMRDALRAAKEADLAWNKDALVFFSGCGTSYEVAVTAARYLTEMSGYNQIGAPLYGAQVPALPKDRPAILVTLSRSGESIEVVEQLRALRAVKSGLYAIAITTKPESSLAKLADAVIGFEAAAEDVPVQTKALHSLLIAARAMIVGQYANATESAILDDLPNKIESVGAPPLEIDPGSVTTFDFLGGDEVHNWASGVAGVAAISAGEIAGMFGRGYPTLSYRHGPIAVTQPTTLVTFLTALTPAHERLRAEIDALGAKTITPEPVKAGDLTYVDPQIELYRAQHLATRIAHALGRDVDAPEGVKAIIDET